MTGGGSMEGRWGGWEGVRLGVLGGRGGGDDLGIPNTPNTENYLDQPDTINTAPNSPPNNPRGLERVSLTPGRGATGHGAYRVFCAYMSLCESIAGGGGSSPRSAPHPPPPLRPPPSLLQSPATGRGGLSVRPSRVKAPQRAGTWQARVGGCSVIPPLPPPRWGGRRRRHGMPQPPPPKSAPLPIGPAHGLRGPEKRGGFHLPPHKSVQLSGIRRCFPTSTRCY